MSMRKIFTHGVLLLVAIVLSLCDVSAGAPRLVVNIVVGSMRAEDMVRYADNFQSGGFRRLLDGGVVCDDAYYDYANTSTPAGLATFATGANPTLHGVIGARWWSHVDSSIVSLIADSKSHPVPFSTGAISCSPHRLTAPTLGDMMLYADGRSKQITVAVDPLSAITLNGKSGVAYWVEKNKTYWTTSAAYLNSLPAWVERYNSEGGNALYSLGRWEPIGDVMRYHNSEVAVVEGIKGRTTKLITDVDLKHGETLYEQMCYTPSGNTMLLKFAAQAIAQEGLGSDEVPDVLNISLDPARYIVENYGPESIEYEDMLYRLDADIADFLVYLYAQVDNHDDVVVVLTSAHGTAPSYNPVGGEERERFNHRQMEVIVNAFLGARYGSDTYVLGFANNAIYLNHAVLHAKHLDIATIREEVAVFLLQLRGVATAISATSLRNIGYGEGRQYLMQQSFHATRSGDVVIDFMPGWMVESRDYRSTSHAGYNYDRRVPLIIYGAALAPQHVGRGVSIVEVAPTISYIMGITQPWASEARPMIEVVESAR